MAPPNSVQHVTYKHFPEKNHESENRIRNGSVNSHLDSFDILFFMMTLMSIIILYNIVKIA